MQQLHVYTGIIPKKGDCTYTKQWSKEKIDKLRKTGDELGDEVVKELIRKNGKLTNIHDLLGTVKQVASEDPSSFSHRFVNLKFPNWVDWNSVNVGHNVFVTHLPFCHLSLLCGSLVGGANFTNAASTTALAGNVTNDPLRRFKETGVLLSNMCFSNSLKSGGAAHEALLRVRLLHSGLRHWLVESGRYKRKSEVAINAHDLAITLAVFSYQNLRSLKRLGVHLSKKEVQGYFHMWQVAGWVLGICDEALPKSLQDQQEFWLASLLHEAHPEKIPEKETKLFLQTFATDLSSKQLKGAISADTMTTFFQQLTVYLNGDDWSVGMNIPLDPNNMSMKVFRAIAFVVGTGMAGYVPFGGALLRTVNLIGVRREIAANRDAGVSMAKGASAPKPIVSSSARL